MSLLNRTHVQGSFFSHGFFAGYDEILREVDREREAECAQEEYERTRPDRIKALIAEAAAEPQRTMMEIEKRQREEEERAVRERDDKGYLSVFRDKMSGLVEAFGTVAVKRDVKKSERNGRGTEVHLRWKDEINGREAEVYLKCSGDIDSW